jgi:3-hydroxyisobutyrate dehydrogenase-like beta-hydroxyacid dehydrogenase
VSTPRHKGDTDEEVCVVTTKPKIGMLGLGTMGGQIARRLVATEYTVTGYEIDAGRARRAAEAGVTMVASPRLVAEASDVVLSSLPDPGAVRRAYLGDDGVLTGVRPGMTLIDVSTIDPDAKARGVDCLDAPVSAGPVEAGNGRLIFIVGGDAAVLDRCRPLLTSLGSEIHHVGPLGSGQAVKLVNNVMSIGNVAVAAEAMVLGVKAGLDPQRLFDILSTSGGRSFHFLKRFPRVLAGDFTPHFSMALSRKDIALALAVAARLEMPMPVASTVRQVYETAHAQGFGELDMAGVTALYEQWTGVKVRGTGRETA